MIICKNIIKMLLNVGFIRWGKKSKINFLDRNKSTDSESTLARFIFKEETLNRNASDNENKHFIDSNEDKRSKQIVQEREQEQQILKIILPHNRNR